MDMIGAALTLSSARYEAIDYLMPISKARNAVFVRDDRLARNLRLTLFLEPFSLGLWLSLGMVAILNLIFVVMLRNQHRDSSNRGPRKNTCFMGLEDSMNSASVVWTTTAANFGWSDRDSEKSPSYLR